MLGTVLKLAQDMDEQERGGELDISLQNTQEACVDQSSGTTNVIKSGNYKPRRARSWLETLKLSFLCI